MAFTAEDIDAIDRAIASGEMRIRFADGREVFYRTIDELRKAKSEITSAVGNSAGTPRIKQIRLVG